MTSWAATMETDIRGCRDAAGPGQLLADEWQHGRIGEVEKGAARGEDEERAVVEQSLHARGLLHPVLRLLVLTSPRATSSSIARDGIVNVAAMLATAIAAIR